MQRTTHNRQVTVVGTGVIGSSWVAHFLSCGMQVRATDPGAGAEARLQADLDASWPTIRRLGNVPDDARDRLEFTTDLAEALHRTTFVQENAPEDKPKKQQLMRDLDALAPSGVIVASSSSGLLPSDLQARCEREPARIIVGHPFHPPHLMPLVEVVGGRATDPTTVDRAMDFYRSVGKHPIHIRRELPGHVANRLQAALWREAFALVEQGAATVEDIDTAVMHGPGLRWALLGPFLTLHLTGGTGGIEGILRHLGPSVQTWWDQFTTPRLTPELQRTVIDGVSSYAGSLGGSALGEQRDRLLVELLALKRSSGFPIDKETPDA